jgi:prepilin-type N-terminal cleavage/methylation domain-containing protein
MRVRRYENGFSLIELLLVLAILGIISAIAIPAFMGQRRRARVIGDAMSNAAVIRMEMETRKADLTVYGSAGATCTWSSAGVPSQSTFLPRFTPKGNSKMKYSIVVGSTMLTYELTVTDPSLGNQIAFKTNQNGAVLAKME